VHAGSAARGCSLEEANVDEDGVLSPRADRVESERK
jgi:hypothetical protein